VVPPEECEERMVSISLAEDLGQGLSWTAYALISDAKYGLPKRRACLGRYPEAGTVFIHFFTLEEYNLILIAS